MTPCLCPRCGATLEIVTDGKVSRTVTNLNRDTPHLTRVYVSAPFGACPRCEFCIEIVTGRGIRHDTSTTA